MCLGKIDWKTAWMLEVEALLSHAILIVCWWPIGDGRKFTFPLLKNAHAQVEHPFFSFMVWWSYWTSTLSSGFGQMVHCGWSTLWRKERNYLIAETNYLQNLRKVAQCFARDL
jgi:hypothetical protein